MQIKTEATKKTVNAIIRVSLAVLLILAFTLSLVACSDADEDFDYINGNHSEYVYIASEDYKNFPVEIPLVSVDESDVQFEINKLLVKNKDKKALYDGDAVYVSGYKIKVGDVAKLWYRAYTTDENGVKTEVPGASNFNDTSPYPLEIGSGNFVKGFEDGLVGKPLQEKGLDVVKTGKVEDGDIIYISYSAFLPNGKPTDVSKVRIDTSDKLAVDKVYGKGFADFLIGKYIGGKAETPPPFRVEGEEIDTAYFNLKIDYVLRSEETPYLLDVVFPADYREKSLRGLKVTFEVYVSRAVMYKTPEWSDSFITDTLKVSPESLSVYEGETLTQKYENKLLSELKASAEIANKSLIAEEMFRYYRSKAEVKKLPEWEVQKMYNQYVNDAAGIYNMYSSSFKTFDEFARYYFGLSSDANWQEFLMTKAEDAVTERLIFFYIINKEGIIPQGEDYDRLYKECIEEYKKYFFEVNKAEIDACKTEEEKTAKRLEIENRMLELYGEKYFRELVYEKYALDYLLAFADLT